MATYDTTQIETLRQVDVLALATEVYGAQLEKCTATEVAGACPCPGCTAARDGFHVNTALNRWKCYSCHPGKWYDAPELVKAVERVGFRQAAEKLLSGNAKKRDVAVPQFTQPATKSPKYNGYTAKMILDNAQDRLWSTTQDGEQARGYLKSRSLLSPVWEQYQIGAWNWVKRDSGELLPSIVLPWYDSDGSLAGLRYRHLSPDNGVKYRVYGNLANRLFGWQANTQPADTVILCEGELNALSLHQAILADGIHVFSTGSQTNRLSESIVAHVSTYGRVIVWMDEPKRADEIAQMLPNAITIDSSFLGGDANELLQARRLDNAVQSLLNL